MFFFLFLKIKYFEERDISPLLYRRTKIQKPNHTVYCSVRGRWTMLVEH